MLDEIDAEPDVVDALEELLSVRDDAAMRNLVRDCLSFPPARRLAMAHVYLRAVRDYEARRAWLRSAVPGGRAAHLAERPDDAPTAPLEEPA